MVRDEPLPPGVPKSTLRFYLDDNADAFADFDAVSTALWQPDRTVRLVGMKGELTRPLLRDLLRLLQAKGVELIHAKRAGKHSLPLGRLLPNGDTELVVADLVKRFL
ncbi:hypothetical protein [Rhodoferax sp.]|uniref:hypothetical protein n=1 Tax=Rhodoferax sp. TaxID=50421 RepID=UPI00374CEBF6